jgi:hypothetical protein
MAEQIYHIKRAMEKVKKDKKERPIITPEKINCEKINYDKIISKK